MAVKKGYTCRFCKKFHRFPAYVYAHYNDQLSHECDCGASVEIKGGVVVYESPPNTKEGAN